jgi:hypothetical protein
VFKIDMNLGSFIFMVFLILAIFLSFLRYFKPKSMEFSLAGAIVKMNGGVVGVRLHSGITVYVYHVENIDTYRELIDSLRKDSLSVEISFRKTYYPFSKTSSMRIACASQDFSQPAGKILQLPETGKTENE